VYETTGSRGSFEKYFGNLRVWVVVRA
jgi:hypothetical protein